MFRTFNVTDRVVHFDYNSILGEDDPEYLKIHEESVAGRAPRDFGLPEAVIFNDSTQLAAAVNNIRDAVNASSATNPLYVIIAGPMEVPWRGIHAADPDKRQYVYCISHTVWNDLFFWDTNNPEITHNKRDLVELGVNWIQIANQQGLGDLPRTQTRTVSACEVGIVERDARIETNRKWLGFMNDSSGWVDRDCSDSGMVYFLLSGNEQPGVEDLRQLLHGNVRRQSRNARPSGSKPKTFSSTTTGSPRSGQAVAFRSGSLPNGFRLQRQAVCVLSFRRCMRRVAVTTSKSGISTARTAIPNSLCS